MVNKVRFLGHAAFEVVTGCGKKILIDPWITGNPACPMKKEEFQGPDLVLITHDHFDHLGEDVPFLVKDSEAVIIAQPEVVGKLKKVGVEEKSFIFGMGMNIGGTAKVYKPEKEVWEEFKKEKSFIIVGIFDARARVWEIKQKMEPIIKYDMADAVNRGCAIAEDLGYGKAAFVKAYKINRIKQAEEGLEDNL